MKKIFLLSIFLLICRPAYSSSLQNSIWASAADYAGINVATFYAIAVQETGMRWDDGSFRPWPWSLYINVSKDNVKAGPRRYASKQAAEQALLKLTQQGIRNVDVGIMQVNLYWHGEKVANDLALLDPSTNIRVAAHYLRELNATRNITRTVGGYHSPSNTALARAYSIQVEKYERIINEKLQ